MITGNYRVILHPNHFHVFGYLRVVSIRNEMFYRSSLLLKEGVPTFDLDEPIPATEELRAKHGIPEGNGTVIEIIVSREDVKIPQFENMRNYLQRHFELRTIMANQSRLIILRHLTGSDKVKDEGEFYLLKPERKSIQE